MRVLRTISLVAALAVTANAVAAQPIGLKFQSGPSSPQVTGYGYYVGPFSGTVLSNPTLPTINLFCVDVLNAIAWGTKWKANVTSLALSDIGNTRHGTGALDNYRKAAWLTTQYSPTNKDQWRGIQAAVWNLLNPGKPNGGNDENFWLNQVNGFQTTAAWSSYEWGQFYVLTPVEAAGQIVGGGPQEFITTSPFVAPEPGSLILLATGLIGVFGLVALRTIRV
jgi:PEP-CTERM motif-containing protein